MTKELTRGKLLTLAAIAALLAAAWWLGEIMPILAIPRWAGVPLALLLAAYLHWGYRGFKWLVGVVLILTGGGAAIHIATLGSSATGTGHVGRSLIAIAAIVVAPVLARSRAVSSYLEHQRRRRPEIAGAILVAAWIVMLAVVAVLIWVRVGAEVF